MFIEHYDNILYMYYGKRHLTTDRRARQLDLLDVHVHCLHVKFINASCFFFQRRGHYPAYFILRWRATLAMTLAKKGCEVALTRAFVVRQQQRGQRGVVERDGDPGPLLDMHADVFIHAGFD